MPAFSAALKDSRTDLIRLARGEENGQKTWYYAKIDKSKFPIYQGKLKAGEVVNIHDYGEVLYAGFGDNPPEEIKEKIRKQFAGGK